MRYVVLDYRVEDSISKAFIEKGFEIVYTKKIDDLINAIDGHVDIQMFFDGSTLFTSRETYDYYVDNFDLDYLKQRKIQIICGESNLSKKYPLDVKYNLCYTGRYYIGNFDFIDKSIQEYLINNKKMDKFISIRQGYSNCSICVLDDDLILTSDRGIKSSIDNYNLNFDENIRCILIEEGDIDLFELNYGFIGGCCGKDSIENKIYFFGSLNKYKNGSLVRKILDEQGIDVVELSSNRLKDYGGIYFI